ncbi:ROK family protein [Weissella cibaria]|uniref:ROK family protein n=1 Tax=Weissella TaxID=46255 RepID=UPI0002191604|nr:MULTISPECIES: ROK family protein [Weissella]APS26424.1 N-acetylglucosamine repressor [Weissella cibaria]APU63927.1 N-acetylglucosamine repressor [Weissella cibaria]APU66077.1 N-acetylglucosamine repressor [Weissella cibaria]ASS52646.1 N-acetylglucosamine repressor [Weissella cibaria]KXU03250.1 Xylose-responsive transcription regulator, ROK family [Weissella sp. DD23]
MVNKVDQDAMRDVNRKLMLQALFNAEQTSRSEIADQIALHKSTVTTIYRDVEDLGYIEELGEGAVSKAGGRKPKLIRFNRQFGYIVSFDLGRHHLRYLVARMTGETIARGQMTVTGMAYRDIKRAMLSYVAQLGDMHTERGLIGVGVAIHGVVEDNCVRYTPFHTDLLEHDLATELTEELDVPVFLENEANLAAVYLRDFHDYDSEETYRNFAVVNIHNGIGAGIIQNERLFRGLHGEAGEIGRQVIINNDYLSAGKFDAPIHIEDLYAEDAMLSRLGVLKGQDEITRDDFLSLYMGGDSDAIALLQEWVHAISRTVYNLAQYAAPEAIFVHSRFIAGTPQLLDLLLQTYHEILPESDTPLFFAKNSVNKATLAGGVAIVTRHLLDMMGYELKFTMTEEDQADANWL